MKCDNNMPITPQFGCDGKLVKEGNSFNKTIIRVLLSLFLFLWGCFLLAGGAIFPVFLLLVIFSLAGMISVPIVWLLRKGGTKINYVEPFIEDKNIFVGHFFGATIYVWGAFAIAFYYIKTGKIFAG